MTVFKTILILLKRNFIYAILSLTSIFIMIPFLTDNSNDTLGLNFNSCYVGDIENATYEEKNLIKYLEKYNIKKENYDSDETLIANKMRAYSIIVDLTKPEGEERVSVNSSLLNLEVHQFLGYLNYYNDFDKANELMKKEVPMKIIGKADSEKKEILNAFLMYQISLFIMMLSGKILSLIYNEDLKKRQIVSSITPKKFTLNVILGMLLILLVAVLITMGASSLFVKYGTKDFMYSFINFMFFGISMISLANLISKVSKNTKIADGFASSITLILAFTSGAFIPPQFANENVIKFGKLFPEYYAIQNVYEGKWSNLAIKNIAIMLLFAIIYFTISIYYEKFFQKGKKNL